MDPDVKVLQTPEDQGMADLVARQRGSEIVGRENIWELGEEVRDTLRSREKVGTAAGRGGRRGRS